MESFFGRMKNEMFYGYEHAFNTLEELQKEMEDCIRYHDNQRITEKLKGLTPVECRNQSLITIQAACSFQCPRNWVHFVSKPIFMGF